MNSMSWTLFRKTKHAGMNFRTLGSIGAVPAEEACVQGHSLVGAAVPMAILPVAAFLSGRRTINHSDILTHHVSAIRKSGQWHGPGRVVH